MRPAGFAIVSACAALCALRAGAAGPFDVKLIAFNDYHGHLQSPGTFGVDTSAPPRSARRSAAPTHWPRTSRG
jgi:hypothetical protein